MAWQTAAGTELALGSTSTPPATFTEAGYSALTYTPVGEVTTVGEFGREYALVTHQPLATRGVKKGKGSFNNGTLSPQLALDMGDAGQLVAETASASDASWPVRITLQDGTIYFMMGKVMSFRKNIGTVDDVVTATINIEVDSDPVIMVEPV